MQQFYVANLRLGHATNSSSSHSLILLGDQPKPRDDQDEGFGRYGWGAFICADKMTKRQYLMLMARNAGLFNALTDDFNGDREAVVKWVQETLGVHVATPDPDDESSYVWSGDYDQYVDHNSLPSFQFNDKWDNQRVGGGTGVRPGDAKAVMLALRDFFDREDLVVAGGNDNSDGFYPVEGGIYFKPGYAVIRRTPNGYLLWERYSGLKMRLVGQDADLRPKVPELVDIKITDYCPLGCTWCYQGSTEDGEHGDLANIKLIAEQLGEAGVLEVAIGGGEPTMHPNFPEILAEFEKRGINANFTSRSLAWFKQPGLFDAISDQARAFAFSVDSADQVRKMVSLFGTAQTQRKERAELTAGKSSWPNQLKVNLHYVMGSTPLSELREILAAVKDGPYWLERVTLLGYKTTERGADFEPHNYDGWYDLAAASGVDISIDTTLAQQSEAVLAANVPATMYHLEEGLFSMYVDAVAMTMAPSSYEPERGHVPFGPGWTERFQQFEVNLKHEASLRDSYAEHMREMATYG